jgi:hypothetical protein
LLLHPMLLRNTKRTLLKWKENTSRDYFEANYYNTDWLIINQNETNIIYKLDKFINL